MEISTKESLLKTRLMAMVLCSNWTEISKKENGKAIKWTGLASTQPLHIHMLVSGRIIEFMELENKYLIMVNMKVISKRGKNMALAESDGVTTPATRENLKTTK